MKNTVQRILWQKKRRWEFFFAGMGFMFGLLLFLFSLQVYFDISTIFKSRLSLEAQSDYILLSKQLDSAQLLRGSRGFSQEELSRLDAQPFTLDTGKVLANRFTARAGVEIFGSGFVTELFFEAVEDKFLDIIPADWHWEEGDTRVPVIISREFLLLYNFGFSQARGFPLLTEEMLGLVPVKLELAGNGRHRTFNARIVGLSDRIASLLVPYSFMEWANGAFSGSEPVPPSRVILSVKNRSDAAIIRYLRQNGYEASREKLRLSDAGFTIRIVLSLVAGLGLLLIILSFIIFMTTFRLTMARSRTEITLLKDLGYFTETLIQWLMSGVVRLFLGLTLVCAALLVLVVSLFHSFLGKNGFSDLAFLHPLVPVLGALAVVAVLGFNYLVIFFTLQERR